MNGNERNIIGVAMVAQRLPSVPTNGNGQCLPVILAPNGHPPIIVQPPYTVRDIAVTVKTAKQWDDGVWRTIELTASATVAPGTDVEWAHNDLFASLRERIMLLYKEKEKAT